MKIEQEEIKTCVIYVRVSSKEQVEGTSLETQEKNCREYCQRMGWEVLKVFIEKGESAKTTNRTEFNKALVFLSNKKARVGYFLVHKIDRFARNQDDHVMVKAILKRYGTKLRSVTEPISETSSGRMMEGILSVVSEFDNNIRAERTKGGLYQRAEKDGMWVWPEPIGYYRPIKPGNIAPDPQYAPFISMVFEEYAKGTCTYKAIAEYISARGFKTKNGKAPLPQLIEKILRNPIYWGAIEVKGQFLRKGNFKPIISKELFDKCQPEYQNQSGHAAPRSANNPEFPLRKVAVCSTCGEKFTGSTSTSGGGNKHPYYHHQHQGCEKSQFIPKATFEQLFVEFLDGITPSEKYEKLFKAVVIDIWKQNYKKFDEDNARIRLEISKLELERQKIFDLHRSGKYSDDEFLEQKDLVNRDISSKHLLIQDKRVEEFNMEEVLDYCFKFVRETANSWLKLEADYNLRLRFQKRVLSGNLGFDGEKFGTAGLSVIYQLNQALENEKSASSAENSSLVALVGDSWNQLISELKEWQLFGQDAKKAETLPYFQRNVQLV